MIARNVVVVISIAAASLASCKKKEEGRAQRSSATDDGSGNRRPPLEPLGPVVGEHAGMRLAVYYADAPRTPPRPELERLLAGEPALKVVTDIASKPPLPFVFYGEPTIAEYAPPDAKSLQYFSRGLSDAEASAFPQSKSVVAIGFFGKSSDALPLLRRAHTVAAALATSTGGVVWSDDVRLAFGAKAWEERGHALDGDTPDIEPLVTIHAYQADPKAGIRLVSLGLAQLGLPDLVIEDVPGAEGERATFTIDLVAQLLAEGAQPAADGRFAPSLADIKNKVARERLQARVEKGGAGKGEVLLVLGEPDEGDADNRLWRIEFYGDGTYHERLARTFADLFGRGDTKVGATADDAELLAASKKAKAELAALRPQFEKGLPDHELLLVKAPFTTDSGGTEYMWLEVRTWKAGRIEGVLTNDAFEIATLHAGSPVEVAEADVYDFLVKHADGSITGNHTTPILEKRQQ